MNHNRGLKQQLIKNFEIEAEYYRTNKGDPRSIESALDMKHCLDEAATIVFPSQQAEVFRDIASKYSETLEYQLPFRYVFLQFTNSITVTVPEKGELQLSCLLLIQDSEKESIAFAWFDDTKSNQCLMLTQIWDTGTSQSLIPGDDLNVERARLTIQSLSIACIGFINCENIYLHREEGAPEAVNRKRAKQGKKILEPYYLCRIRGVQYDSNGHAIGEGTQHGFIYDVRGHFRKLTSGKTIWVRPHQRRLHSGGPYIPKTYIVDDE